MHNPSLFVLYFAHSTSSLFKPTTTAAVGGSLRGWPAPLHCRSYAATHESESGQRCADRKYLIRASPRISTKDPRPHIIAICNIESTVRTHLNATVYGTHITTMYDKMLTNCSISNDPVISSINIQINHSFFNVF